MPSSWTVTGSNGDLMGLGERIKKRYHDKGVEAMASVVVNAVDDMKRFTSTRPSAKSGKAGRVDTAAMLEAIASKSFLEGADAIIGEFGFLDRRELYFKLQTATGFEHYLSGDFIEPTFAMRDAATLAIQRLMLRLAAG